MWTMFPIKPGTKIPAFQGDWRLHGSSDPAQWDAWRDAGYDLAVDCEASDLLVVDADGSLGIASAATMNLPETYTMETPGLSRGGDKGKQFYYIGTGPSSVQKLGPKVDTRGIGGYVVWEAEGYIPLNGTAVLPTPDWIVPALNIRKDRKPSATTETDHPNDIRRAREYLSVRRPAIEGEGGNDHTYQTAAALRDLGLGEQTACDMLLGAWNDRCSPPWDEGDLATVVANAFRYAQNDGGAQALTFDPLTRFNGIASGHIGPEKKRSQFRLWSLEEVEAEPPLTWLLPRILPAETVGVAYGQKKNGKTWLTLDMALHLATGKAGYGREKSEPVDVLYYCGEGVRGLVQKRIMAWRSYHWGGRPIPHFKLLKRFPNFTSDDEMDELDQEILAEKRSPKLMVVDTYARVMARAGRNEADQGDATLFVVTMEDFKERWGCTVLAIHHSGKDKTLGPRGASALLAAADFSYEIMANWDVKAIQLRCEDMKEGEPFDTLYFEALPHEDSLVVRGILPNEYKHLTEATEDILGPRMIQAVLAKAHAYGKENAMPFHALAAELYTPQIGEPQAEVEAKRDRIARKLKALGKGRHEHLVQKTDGYFLPE